MRSFYILLEDESSGEPARIDFQAESPDFALQIAQGQAAGRGRRRQGGEGRGRQQRRSDREGHGGSPEGCCCCSEKTPKEKE